MHNNELFAWAWLQLIYINTPSTSLINHWLNSCVKVAPRVIVAWDRRSRTAQSYYTICWDSYCSGHAEMSLWEISTFSWLLFICTQCVLHTTRTNLTINIKTLTHKYLLLYFVKSLDWNWHAYECECEIFCSFYDYIMSFDTMLFPAHVINSMSPISFAQLLNLSEYLLVWRENILLFRSVTIWPVRHELQSKGLVSPKRKTVVFD